MTRPNRNDTPDKRGPDLFYAGGECLTRHGTLVRQTQIPEEDAARETHTRNSDGQAIGRDGILRTWNADLGRPAGNPRVEWLREEDLEATRNGIFSSAAFSAQTAAGWYTGNATLEVVSPSRARIVENTADNNHEIRQNNQNPTTGETLLFSFEFLPRGTRTGVRVRALDLANVANGVTLVYDTETQSAQLTLGGVGFSNEAFNAIKGPDGWWQISIRFDPPSTTGLQLTVGPAIGSDFDYLGDGSHVDTRHFQLEANPPGSIATAYQATPRNPDRRFPSLLLEAFARNEARQSEDLTGGSWIQSNVTVNTNTTDPPYGTDGSADSLFDNAVNNYHRIVQTIPWLSGETACHSAWMKAGSADYGIVWIADSTDLDNRIEVAVNLLTGEVIRAVSIGTGTLVAAGAIEGPNGWWRVWVAGTTAWATSTLTLLLSETGESLYLGSVSGIFVWGSQGELGSAPSSYIKTDGAGISREADEFRVPYPTPPVEATYYFKQIARSEVGYFWDHRNSSEATPRLALYRNGLQLEAFHNPGNGAVTSNVTPMPKPGELAEFRVELHRDGSVLAAITIDGGTEVKGPRSAAPPAPALGAEWGDPISSLGSSGNDTQHSNADFLAVKINRGIRSLSFMRAL